MYRRKLDDPALVSRIRELRGIGRSVREIAEQVGICHAMVAKALGPQRKPPPPGRPKPFALITWHGPALVSHAQYFTSHEEALTAAPEQQPWSVVNLAAPVESRIDVDALIRQKRALRAAAVAGKVPRTARFPLPVPVPASGGSGVICHYRHSDETRQGSNHPPPRRLRAPAWRTGGITAPLRADLPPHGRTTP